MANVVLENVSKVYKGNVKAVTDFSLAIRDKEFVVFVGPSGCGKSTTLRMIAGLEEITSGKLFIDGKLMNYVEPRDRDIAMVFQNYALYPHMDVYGNIAYPLRCHHMPKDEIVRRVNEAADILGIKELLHRKPKELSGGQRQRVALGRAIVRHPKVFLLDEPLSNLDAKLRVQMRSEISRLHQRLQTTFIYVTHDQTEAMTMGDRIVVMNSGVIQQVDTPLNLYDFPANLFVATFLGNPQMNIIDGSLAFRDGKAAFVSAGTDSFALPIDSLLINQIANADGLKVKLGVRPNDVNVDPGCANGLKTKVELLEKLGDQTLVYFYVPGRKDLAIASVPGTCPLALNQKIAISFKADKIHLFDTATGHSLTDTKPKPRVPYDTAGILTPEQRKKLEARLIFPMPKDPVLSFDPNDLEAGPKANADDLQLEGRVLVTRGYSDRNVVYAKERKTGQVFAIDLPLDTKIGSSIMVHIPLRKVNIYDPENKEKVTDGQQVTQKPLKAEMEIKDQGAYVPNPGLGNEEKDYKVLRMNKLGKKTLLELEGNKTKQKMALLVQSSPLFYDSMLVMFRHSSTHWWQRSKKGK